VIDRPADLRDVLPAAAALLGVPGAHDRLGLADRVGDVARVVVLLVDGMGSLLLPRMAPDAPLLASALAGEVGRLDELSCPFPSTTPTSLVSLGTGVGPGEHGVTGFTVNIPGTDRLLTHIAWGDDPPPRQWQPVPTWYERTARAGISAKAVLPAAFGGSGLTDAAYRGAEFCGVPPHDDYVTRLLAEVAAARGLVFAYTSVLDTAAHVHGIASTEWSAAAAQVDALLGRVLEGLPPDTALVVTADHGGLDVPPDARVDVGADPRLADGLRVLAGEPRVRYLHTVAGAAADVAATWGGLLGERAHVLSRDQAVAGGLFGPVRPEHLARIGDVVVICRDDAVVLATDREPPELARLIGFHGSTTAAETAIPLLSVRA
jgi:hypothetical protein